MATVTCGVTHARHQRDVDASHGKLVAGDVIGVFGATAVVVGGSLLLFYKPTPQTVLSALPVQGGAAMVVAGRV